MQVIHMSGESRYIPNTAVDYMMELIHFIGSDRDTILYAERPINNQISEEETYYQLKQMIIEQAFDFGINPLNIDFGEW